MLQNFYAVILNLSSIVASQEFVLLFYFWSKSPKNDSLKTYLAATKLIRIEFAKKIVIVKPKLWIFIKKLLL